jgi:quercetin dioxygenase-like cupin family protein
MCPIVNAHNCQAPHTMYTISGSKKVVMEDGTEDGTRPGDSAVIPPGHNAWVIEKGPCIAIDFTGAKDYAKKT